MLDLEDKLLERKRQKLIAEIDQLTNSKNQQTTLYQQDVGTLRKQKSLLLVQVEQLKKDVRELLIEKEGAAESADTFIEKNVDESIARLRAERAELKNEKEVVESIKALLLEKSQQLRLQEIKNNEREIELNHQIEELRQKDLDLSKSESDLKSKVDTANLELDRAREELIKIDLDKNNIADALEGAKKQYIKIEEDIKSLNKEANEKLEAIRSKQAILDADRKWLIEKKLELDKREAWIADRETISKKAFEELKQKGA